MRYLVTGGAGFLGAAVVQRLLQDGDEAVVYDQASDNVLAHVLGAEQAQQVTVRGDVTDGLHLLKTAKERGVDGIVHLPSLLGPAANQNPGAAVRVNCGGLVNALETARILGLKKVVWASTSGVYRGYLGGEHVANDAPYRPVNIYGATKIMGEMLGAHYTNALGVDTVGLRFILMNGPGKWHRPADVARRSAAAGRPLVHASPTTELWYGLSVELIEKPLRGEVGRVPFGDDVANWLWVGDGARAVALAARTRLPPARAYTVAGDLRPIKEAVAVARQLLPNAEILLQPGQHRLEQDWDQETIRRDLGYAPTWRMEDQIAALLDEVRARLAVA